MVSCGPFSDPSCTIYNHSWFGAKVVMGTSPKSTNQWVKSVIEFMYKVVHIYSVQKYRISLPMRLPPFLSNQILKFWIGSSRFRFGFMSITSRKRNLEVRREKNRKQKRKNNFPHQTRETADREAANFTVITGESEAAATSPTSPRTPTLPKAAAACLLSHALGRLLEVTQPATLPVLYLCLYGPQAE